MTELFAPLQAAGGVRTTVADRAWVQAMLDAEAALAAALAEVGRITEAEARAIAAACDASAYDPKELGERSVGSGNPVVPLVAMLRVRVGGEAASSVHLAATSQDILDTATMLVARAALDVIRDDLGGCLDLLAGLAGQHGDTVQAGRTLLQLAAPTTFGLTAAGWLAGLLHADAALVAARSGLAVQLGGAVGTLAGYGEDGPRVVAAMAARLGLAEPRLPWHTERGRIAVLAGALGHAAGSVAAIARSITLLAQSEVGELAEVGPAGTGTSSAMPHKRNPVASVLAVSCAAQAPGLVATLLASMGQEYQRAAGGWHAQWRPLTELLLAAGSASWWLRTSLQRLQVDSDRMRRTVDDRAGLLTAERVWLALTPTLGRAAAQDVVGRCARRSAAGEGPLADLLAAEPLVSGVLDKAELIDLTDPGRELDPARELTRRALEDYRKWRESS